MHEAKRSRAKADAENGRTGDSIFRAAISSASNERTSRLWARAALFEPLGWLELHPSSILRFRGGSSGTRRAFCGSGADSSGTHRAFCGSGANSIDTFRVFCGSRTSSSGHPQHSAAPKASKERQKEAKKERQKERPRERNARRNQRRRKPEQTL